MALTYLGETEFVQSDKPQWSQSFWDLDTLIIPFSGPIDHLEHYLDTLEKGSASDIDDNMFLIDWRISGTKVYPQVDLVYTGKRGGVMPPKKKTSGGNVASATTNTDSLIFPATVTNPATVQFYSVTNTLSFYSIAKDDATVVEDPPMVTSLISWDLGAGLQPGYSFPGLATFLLTSAFVQGIIEPPPEIEPIVDDGSLNHIYRIVKRKTRTLFPYAPPE